MVAWIAGPRGGDQKFVLKIFMVARYICQICGALRPTKSPALWAVWRCMAPSAWFHARVGRRCLSHIALQCVAGRRLQANDVNKKGDHWGRPIWVRLVW